MPHGTKVSVIPGDTVLDGDSAPPPKKRGHSPQFSAHVCCGEMAGLLGTEVDLGPGDIVLDGDQLPLQRGTAP